MDDGLGCIILHIPNGWGGKDGSTNPKDCESWSISDEQWDFVCEGTPTPSISFMERL